MVDEVLLIKLGKPAFLMILVFETRAGRPATFDFSLLEVVTVGVATSFLTQEYRAENFPIN